MTVCVLAYNEANNIGRTLTALCAAQAMASIPVYVYANGCTDATAQEVARFAERHGNVYLRELPVASKPNAWNTAFAEQTSDFLVFSDGDIIVEPGAAFKLVGDLEGAPGAVIATCRQVSTDHGLTTQQKLVGFMQIPLVQNFLAGGFYAVRRQALADLLAEKGFAGLPLGVTGEDAFLDYLVGPERLLLSEVTSAYTPPNLSDYCRYLARIRWQNEQIRHCWGNVVPKSRSLTRFRDKVLRIRRLGRLFVASLAVAARSLYKICYACQIAEHYRMIGPLRESGAEVLRDGTRSLSTK